MMNYIWSAMLVISFVCAALNGRMEQVTSAIIDCGNSALTVFIPLYGVMVFWGGLMNVAEKAGVTGFIGRLTYPALRFLFPSLKKGGEEMNSISMNITANLLGLGNAATPLGIEAMRKLRLLNSESKTASNEMVTLVVLNSASLRLIPTTVAMLRSKHSSASPMEILLPGLCASALALFVGLTVSKLLGAGLRRRKL